jgi:3-methyladenine DNA glycosylase AlkC
MAEPLKNAFGPAIAKRLAETIVPVFPAFPARAFTQDALNGYEPLALLDRGRQIARALARHLPQDFGAAAEILVASLGPRLERTENNGMAPFFYLPHTMFVSNNGLDHFEASMRALYELTQRFTAEMAIRPFIVQDPKRTLARLRDWSGDPNVHVRRLVSEGTRPRLPWAMRLPDFQRDPKPVIALLERLKDDPELYVRRSVANNLNDIGKDHPAILTDVAAKWLVKASPARTWIVRHALRSAIKRGEAAALAVLDYAPVKQIRIANAEIAPKRAKIGGKLTIAFDVTNAGKTPARLMVDFRIHYVKARGTASAKTFKLTALDLAPRATVRLAKSVSLKDMTTRKHHPGEHRVEAMINGHVTDLGGFQLSK